MRSALLELGLLGSALPLLQQCTAGDHGPFAALSTALDTLPQPSNGADTAQPSTAAATSLCPVMLQLHCRTALHLQLAAATSPAQTAATSPANASQQGTRAVPSSQNRQGSAARGTFGQQQADIVAGQDSQEEEEDGKACMAAAAEAAVQDGCEVVQKLLRQLQGLSASAVAELMVSCIALPQQLHNAA